ncbi:MAG: DUF898 domain-containing protein [Deltaproteobacteria bacterium]|nr:DUF898 domain-containing protein [Deltaproteobacteria bacterium]
MDDQAQPPQEALPTAPAPSPGEAAPPAVARVPREVPVRFTGTGGEYFRIWAVNLLLTIATLGIYSAWAKVRKTRWFWGNTQVDGASFQFHGSPMAILRGRILVGVAFGLYTLLGRISVGAAVVGSVVLAAAAPWLLQKALRFRLSNSTWRGLRFGFASTTAEAYGALAPAVVLWLMFTVVMTQVTPGAPPSPFAILGIYALALALAPLLHHRFKRWQHGATTCGGLRFALQPSIGPFYKLYGLTFLVGVLPFGMLMGAMIAIFAAVRPPAADASVATLGPALVGIYLGMALVYLVPGAYFSARLQRLVWSRTQGGPVRFSTRVTMWGMVKVWLVNGLLTLLTLGLYWPYAAVAIARYKLECMSLATSAPLEEIAAGAGTVEASATGEGAVDVFGWDFGL